MAEKTINEISRDARMLFTKGSEAAQRDNLDYAIDLFNQVLEKEPEFFECRKSLRSVQFKKRAPPARDFQEDVEWRRLLAADCQGTNRPAHQSRQRARLAEQV